MNTKLDRLQPYPFEKLGALYQDVLPPENLPAINLSIGEPKHQTPEIVLQALKQQLADISKYPLTKGSLALRNSIASWLSVRFSIDTALLSAEDNVLPVNGTREALFAFAQTVVPEGGLVLMPNPFYQIYEGAAILAGAQPYFINIEGKDNFQPDFDSVPAETWQACQLLYICSPNNPTGLVINQKTLEKLIVLSQQYDFVIASDECYSEIYFDEENPPVGLLEVAAKMAVTDFKNCVVFHSLSKRSNVPGLRSGFVAGDAEVLKAFLLYRTYHGSAMPPHHQAASVVAWQDEQHVLENRHLYQEKFKQVLETLNLKAELPEAGFYLWLKTPIDDTAFAKGLFEAQNVIVLPGSFLSREVSGYNPAKGYVRMALVASVAECVEAAKRINQYLTTLVPTD